MTAAIKARSVTKCFGSVVALDGVDLDIAEAEIHGLVGPNGAGKTTLLGLLLGLTVADTGRLEILGTEVRRALSVPDGVSGFVDGPGLYPSLTARQNLSALVSLRRTGSVSERDVDDVLEQVGLADVTHDRVRGFSLGMRQRLGLAAALLVKPRVLVLDEPVNGLDPAAKHHVHDIITALADAGTTVVLSSHRMDDLTALCSEVTVLVTGQPVFSGPLGKLTAECGDLDYRVVTSDPVTARAIAAATPGLRMVERRARAFDVEPVLVRGPEAALDELVVRLVRAGLAVRELGPVISPLEAAFLALTGDTSDASDHEARR